MSWRLQIGPININNLNLVFQQNKINLSVPLIKILRLDPGMLMRRSIRLVEPTAFHGQVRVNPGLYETAELGRWPGWKVSERVPERKDVRVWKDRYLSSRVYWQENIHLQDLSPCTLSGWIRNGVKNVRRVKPDWPSSVITKHQLGSIKNAHNQPNPNELMIFCSFYLLSSLFMIQKNLSKSQPYQ